MIDWSESRGVAGRSWSTRDNRGTASGLSDSRNWFGHLTFLLLTCCA